MCLYQRRSMYCFRGAVVKRAVRGFVRLIWHYLNSFRCWITPILCDFCQYHIEKCEVFGMFHLNWKSASLRLGSLIEYQGLHLYPGDAADKMQIFSGPRTPLYSVNKEINPLSRRFVSFVWRPVLWKVYLRIVSTPKVSMKILCFSKIFSSSE